MTKRASLPTIPAIIAAVCWLAVMPVHAQVSYFRCADPPDKCIAYTEAEKADCAECKTWKKIFLDFQVIMQSARAEQKQAGVKSSQVASNFFIDAASEQIYGFDIGVRGGSPPKTREMSKNPAKYGLRTLRQDEPKVGSFAIIGDVAGIVTEKDGELLIAYPSSRTGKVRFAAPAVLADSEKATVKYIEPAEKHQ
jgi:hypothetical protein